MNLDKFLSKSVDDCGYYMDEVLFFDGHNLLFRTVHVADKFNPLDTEFKYWRYLMLNSILTSIKKHKPTKVIIAFDGKEYWRKEIYSEYKAQRAGARKKSPIDFEAFFLVANEFINGLNKLLPNCYILRDNELEADDIIAVGTREVFKKCKSIINISNDKDMNQLLTQPNYKQYDPIKRKFFNCLNPKRDLEVKLLTGDNSDNIPGVVKRCGPSTANSMLDNGLELVMIDEDIKANYERNKALIDFDCIPVRIVNKAKKIIEDYETDDFDIKAVYKYFIDIGFAGYAMDLQDFVPYLRKLS